MIPDADDPYALGVAAYRHRDFESAARLFHTATSVTTAAAWKGLSRALSRLGRWQEAREAAKTVTELRPDDPRAWRAYARLCLGAEREDLALQAWERVVHLAPEDSYARLAAATLLYRADRFREAGESLGKAVGLRPGFAEAHYLLGHVHLALDDPSSAAQQLRLLRPLDAELAADLQRAIAPHRQGTIVTVTVVVLTLWLGAGKWFVPQRLAQAWHIGGFVLFGMAFLAYRAYHRQAHPEGISLPHHGDEHGQRPDEQSD